MPEFRVTYEADVEAGTPEQAAQVAWDLATDPASLLPVLTVRPFGATGAPGTDIDLQELAEAEDEEGR